MNRFSSSQAAKKLGISITSLERYIASGKIPAPTTTKIGDRNVRAWTETDIERVRDLLPKIANGRKTRYQKQSARQMKPKPKKNPQAGRLCHTSNDKKSSNGQRRCHQHRTQP